MTTVAELLDQLERGELTTEQVAADFVIRTWPTSTRKTTLAEIETDPDPEPDPVDSFAEVTQAFADDRITMAQYAILAEAATRH